MKKKLLILMLALALVLAFSSLALAADSFSVQADAGSGKAAAVSDGENAYVVYTDAENRFNADASIPAGDVGTVAEMDFSRFVHGGSGVYQYWLSISDADNSGYTYSFNEATGLLRLTRDYPRAASLKNSAGWYNCQVEIYDEKTGCGAIL